MFESAARTLPGDPAATLSGVSAAEIRSELNQILRSRAFIQSRRIRRFLQFIVEESLLGQQHRLKEYPIGLEVFDRRETFDPRVDSIVRVEARRLRNKLDEYYQTEGRDDHVRILLHKGSYMPIFESRTASAAVTPAPRRTVEIAPLALINPAEDSRQLAGEIQRRLAHTVIKEGYLQVIARPQADLSSAESSGHTHPSPYVDYIIEASLEFHPGNIHLIVQLFNSSEGSYTWSEAIDFDAQDLRPVERLAQSLIRDLTATQQTMVARRHAEPKESRDLYLRGRFHWKLGTPDSIRASVVSFTQAVESDPNYAAAWAALAEALLASAMFGFFSPREAGPKMKDAALKATSLSPLLPEARVALGSVLSILDLDWTAGEQELAKSIQLDHHNPTGHAVYGIQLACRGGFDSAVAEVERALELDPASLFTNFVLGWVYGVCRRYEEAIAQHLLVCQLAPDYPLPHFGLGLAYVGQHNYHDAIAHFTNANQLKCRWLIRGHLGYCYAITGRRAEALHEMTSLAESSGAPYVSPANFAYIAAGLGEKDQALAHLEQALQDRDPSLPVNLLNPEFDTLRDEPRFQALRQKLGLA